MSHPLEVATTSEPQFIHGHPCLNCGRIIQGRCFGLYAPHKDFLRSECGHVCRRCMPLTDIPVWPDELESAHSKE